MSDQQPISDRQVALSRPKVPVWWLVFKWELTDLWIGGRVLNLLILFSVLMSITAFLLATNDELSLASTEQTVFVVLQAAMTFGLFIGLIVAAESISGERERATFEMLLLTPTSRRQLVFGKYLAALTPWPAALVLTIPYMAMLAQGNNVLGPALLWGAILGSILAVVFTGIGMLISIWSNSNRVSLFVSLMIYLLSLLPAQIPGEAQGSFVGTLLQTIDPSEAARQFLQLLLVDGKPLNELWFYLVGAIVVAVLIVGLLFVYAASRLRLEAGRVGIVWPLSSRREALK